IRLITQLKTKHVAQMARLVCAERYGFVMRGKSFGWCVESATRHDVYCDTQIKQLLRPIHHLDPIENRSRLVLLTAREPSQPANREFLKEPNVRMSRRRATVITQQSPASSDSRKQTRRTKSARLCCPR